VIEGKLKVTYGRLHGFWTQIPLIAVCGEPWNIKCVEIIPTYCISLNIAFVTWLDLWRSLNSG
jgi:hypothetical protein